MEKYPLVVFCYDNKNNQIQFKTIDKRRKEKRSGRSAYFFCIYLNRFPFDLRYHQSIMEQKKNKRNPGIKTEINYQTKYMYEFEFELLYNEKREKNYV